jgi:hypothetical protein
MGDEKNALIYIDGKHLGKAAQVLIEKVSLGVGGLFRPAQIKRLARAEAVASLIETETELKIGELQYRAAHRWLAEESRKQDNMESITDKAIPLLDEAADASKVEDDWIANFFEKSRSVSDGDMQYLWSKLLAGESNSPGKFNRRTVNVLADLDKSDAELFATVCRYSWGLLGSRVLVFDVEAQPYIANGINFASLTHLDSLGLLTFTNVSDYALNGLPSTFACVYHGKPLFMTINQGAPLNVGKVMLTKAGEQLATLVKADEVPGFYDYVVDHFDKAGVIVSPVSNSVTISIPPTDH